MEHWGGTPLAPDCALLALLIFIFSIITGSGTASGASGIERVNTRSGTLSSVKARRVILPSHVRRDRLTGEAFSNSAAKDMWVEKGCRGDAAVSGLFHLYTKQVAPLGRNIIDV